MFEYFSVLRVAASSAADPASRAAAVTYESANGQMTVTPQVSGFPGHLYSSSSQRPQMHSVGRDGSMRRCRIYVTVGCPSVRPSVPSIAVAIPSIPESAAASAADSFAAALCRRAPELDQAGSVSAASRGGGSTQTVWVVNYSESATPPLWSSAEDTGQDESAQDVANHPSRG